MRREIEELIEESYLLSLSEPEIRQYLSIFLDSCETVIQRQIGLYENTRMLKVKITMMRVRLQLRERKVPVSCAELPGRSRQMSRPSIELLASQVVRTKRKILDLLNEVHPRLDEEVIRELERLPKPLHRRFHRMLDSAVMAVCYLLLLGVTLIVSIMFLLH